MMRAEEMPDCTLPQLIDRFERQCRLERKAESTCTWYRGILTGLPRWAGPIAAEDLTLEKARDYFAHLTERPRYSGHPTTPANGRTVSPQTFRHHVVVLRIFSRWLFEEGYTEAHRLERLRMPKVPETVADALSPHEVHDILRASQGDTPQGRRDHAMLVLALDTGLRMSEIAGLQMRHLDLERGVLRAFGKGAKERLVPFGYTAARAVQRYLLRGRPAPALPQFDYVFLQQNGWPLTKTSMDMVARRIRARSGGERFHWHLLRHTFAVNYLINGGDPFSLQRALGHTTLEMVRRYLHLSDVHVRLQHRRYSPMDVMQAEARELAPGQRRLASCAMSPKTESEEVSDDRET